jgi:D-serine deaminase-like pyridoxal phosphate-dependent protein
MSHDWRYLNPGSVKAEIPTPALMIDLPIMEANLNKMADFFIDRAACLRPHFKTHKCPEIARRQIANGAIGITCAKLGEAEELVKALVPSILIANEIVDHGKIYRLAELACQTQIIVAVDQPENLHQISTVAQEVGSTVQVLVEVNVGMNRCGVATGQEALSLARLAIGLPNIRFMGVMGYEGHTITEPDPDQRYANVQLAMGKLVSAAEEIRGAGIPVEIVSAGGTGTYAMTGAYPGITEVQAGSYVFMDSNYSQIGLQFENSLSLLATIISRPSPRRAVIDSGMKVLSTDHGLPEIISPVGVRLVSLHEEHGILEIEHLETDLKIGDRVEIRPSHACTTVNLHDQFYVIQNEVLEMIWEITGRGKSQ